MRSPSRTYLLFAWSGLPYGGANDFIGAYETLEEAKEASNDQDWAHIAESDTLAILGVNYSGRWRKPAEELT